MTRQRPQVPKLAVELGPTAVAEGDQGHDVRVQPRRLGGIQAELALVPGYRDVRELRVRRSELLELPDGGWHSLGAPPQVLGVLEDRHHPEASPLGRLARRDRADGEVNEDVALGSRLLHPLVAEVRDPPWVISVSHRARSLVIGQPSPRPCGTRGRHHHDVVVAGSDPGHDGLLRLGVQHVVLLAADEDVDLVDIQPKTSLGAELVQVVRNGGLALRAREKVGHPQRWPSVARGHSSSSPLVHLATNAVAAAIRLPHTTNLGRLRLVLQSLLHFLQARIPLRWLEDFGGLLLSCSGQTDPPARTAAPPKRSRTQRGLLLGRFLNLHVGHLLTIETCRLRRPRFPTGPVFQPLRLKYGSPLSTVQARWMRSGRRWAARRTWEGGRGGRRT